MRLYLIVILAAVVLTSCLVSSLKATVQAASDARSVTIAQSIGE